MNGRLQNILIATAVALYFFFPYSVRLVGLRLPFFLPFLGLALILSYKNLNKLPRKILAALALFIFAVAISTWQTSADAQDLFWGIEPLLIAAAFFIATFFWGIERSKLLTASAIFVFISSLLAFLQFWTEGYRYYPALYFWGQPNIHYAFGFASYASLFGLEMIMLIPFMLAWITEARRNWERRLAQTAFILGSIAVFLSFSLASWLGYIFSVGLIFVLARQSWFQIIGLSSLVALAIILILTWPPLKEGRVLAETYRTTQNLAYHNVIPQDSAVRTRLATLQAGLAMFRERPLFGWGANGFRKEYHRFRPDIENIDPRTNINAHNTYLEALVAGGIVGGLGLFALMALGVKRAFKEYLDTRDALTLALLAGFIALLVHAAFHTILYDKFLWIILGYIYGRTTRSTNIS